MPRRRAAALAIEMQTREYLTRLPELVAVLRREVSVPERPRGTPAAIVLMGPPGVGKSHCARLLAERLGAATISSDMIRTRLFIAPSYAPEESRTVFAAAAGLLDLLLGEGHMVIVDATNMRARDRVWSSEVAMRHAVPVVHVRVVAEEAEILQRLAGRRKARAPGDHSDADERIYRQMRAFEPPTEGSLELRNGVTVSAEIERIAREVERQCSPAG